MELGTRKLPTAPTNHELYSFLLANGILNMECEMVHAMRNAMSSAQTIRVLLFFILCEHSA